ncbi:transposase [Nitrosomonas sp. ANs5]|uniref:transposase n=1 Tax=Nitrosomonas sp. ANs5 TaxID=3423941 RepID=UPI003D355FF2
MYFSYKYPGIVKSPPRHCAPAHLCVSAVNKLLALLGDDLRIAPQLHDATVNHRKTNAHGFSLHTGVRCAMNQRKELEHLCRYITRPAIANERLTLNDAGQVVLTLKTPYRDGTTHIVMSPLEFMQRLAALIPRPRLNLISFNPSSQLFP